MASACSFFVISGEDLSYKKYVFDALRRYFFAAAAPSPTEGSAAKKGVFPCVFGGLYVFFAPDTEGR